MNKLLYFQIAFISIAVVLSWLFFGYNIAVSVLFGGGCYLLPTATMIIVLYFYGLSPEQAARGFFVGQSVKAILAILLMVAVFIFYPSLNFPGFLVGFLVVSKTVFFVFWKLSRYGRK